MENNKGSKFLVKFLVFIIVILLIVISGGIGWYFGKEGKLFNNNNNNTIEETKISKKIDESKPWVYDAEYGKDKAIKTIEPWNNEVNPNSKDDLVVPYININSTAAEKANKNIKELYEKMYEEYASNAGDSGKRGCSLNYKFYENENILSVIIDASYFVVPGGAGNCPIYVYNFNLDTLETATLKEMAVLCGFNSESDVINKINAWEQRQNDLAKANLDKVAAQMTGVIDGQYFIDKNKKLNFIYESLAAGDYYTPEVVEPNKDIPDYYDFEDDKTNTQQNSTTSENVLYLYSSGDNAAAHGNGELLYVYELNDNIVKFKYHTPWNKNDVSGTATKTNQDLYVYEKDTYKIEILLNSMGDNSVKVTEYNNGVMGSWKNLWK